MKKLFLICTTIGFLAACNSNKKSISSNRTTAQETQQANNSNKVNRINEETNYVPGAKTTSHLDSVMEKSGSAQRKYNNLEGRFQGASGVGMGGSYAGAGYAQSRYKKKPKPKVRRTFDAPVEVEEAAINKNVDSTILGKESINNNVDSTNLSKEPIINNVIDSTNVSKEVSDFNETKDSASTNQNSTW